MRTSNRGLEFYAFPRDGDVAGEMRYRKRFLERKACVDLADIRRKKGLCVCARPLCTVVRLCRERPSARARFPLCNTSDFKSIALLLIFCGKFYGTSTERTSIEIRKLSHGRNTKSLLKFQLIARDSFHHVNILLKYFNFVTLYVSSQIPLDIVTLET